MKFIRNIFTIFASAAILTSCNFLDMSESDYYELEEIQESFDKVKAHCTNIYGYLRHGFCNVDGAMHDAASDDALHIYESSNIQRFVNGTWAPNNTIDDEFAHYYQGIRDANFYFENLLGLEFDSWKTNTEYEDKYKEYLNYEHEIRVLRAYFYFELVRRYQNIPLITKVLNQSEANTQTPVTSDVIFQFIIDECTKAAQELPVNYKDFKTQEFGRITKGAALALKSRAALYAASPLFNKNNDKTKWIAAAEAASEIISNKDVFGYDLDEDFLHLFGETNRNSKEIIFYRHYQKGNDFEQANFPWGVIGGNTSTCPSENLVSSFETIDGRPFDWNDDTMNKRPYSNRDPRLEMTVAHNGQVWPTTPLEIYEGGANAQPLPNATKTGYYLRKYVNGSVNFAPGAKPRKPEHNWIFFRYAEILLNYAEAMTNAYGDVNKTTTTCPMSALEAVNMVRARKGVEMPPIPSMAPEEFLARVKNERRVELAFEGHRFWDIRRWKELDNNNAIKCVMIKKVGRRTYYTFKDIKRTVEDKMYFYPINNREIFINSNLIQNPGW